jgi:hypothetical protein
MVYLFHVPKTDDRVFSSLNSTPVITNAFEGLWDFRVKGICPLREDTFVGEYRITYGYVYPPAELPSVILTVQYF